ncbi:fumarylacetoacetate hydrolase family protein [bacterium]|nr:fumarylacetoacetate hydrolase family protein [bacterium]
MRLCTVSVDGLDPFFGIELKGRVLRIAAAAEAFKLRPSQRAALADMTSYLHAVPGSERTLRSLLKKIADEPKNIAGKAEDGFAFLFDRSGLTYHPPVPSPQKVLCVGLNYKDHCEEQNKPIPKIPIIFNKFPTSLIGHEAEIPLPLKIDEKIDYEAELAFVIGKRAKNVKKRSALSHVAGYMILNDVSARSLQWAEKQWSRAKGFDGSGPCGPVLVTPDEVKDPHALSICCRLNGKVMQKSNTKHLVFKVQDLIQHITQVITLEPGDIVSTGTPGGVGVYREPQIFMKPGDTVEVEIEGLGKLINKCGTA